MRETKRKSKRSQVRLPTWAPLKKMSKQLSERVGTFLLLLQISDPEFKLHNLHFIVRPFCSICTVHPVYQGKLAVRALRHGRGTAKIN